MPHSRLALLSLAFAFGTTGFVASRAEAQVPLVQSTFVAGAEGWVSVTLPFPSAVPPTVSGTFAPTWVAGLGGYITLVDPDGTQQTGQVQYWEAPAPWLGLQSAAFGGTLEFDLANSLGSSFFTQEDVLLIGGGLTLVHALGGVPVPAFTHFSIPMSETGWKVGGLAGPAATAQQMHAALFAVEHLYIRAEYKNAQDTQFLDNVTLFANPAAVAPWIDLGFGLAGVTGIPGLTGTGTLAPGSAGSLTLVNARPASLAVLFVSFAGTPTPFKGGTLVPVPVLLSISLGTNGAGALTLPWTWPAGIPSATPLFFQYAIQDAAAPQGASLSNALRAVTP